MAEAIRGLVRQPLPSSRARPGMLDGLDKIIALAKPILSVNAYR
jgi:hypothetical protein